MKTAQNYRLVMVTAPDLPCARKLGQAALQARAAACVSWLPNLESHYWWQGKMESSQEILMLFKTTRQKLPTLEKIIIENHPYDTPEILALKLDAGSAKYLTWLGETTAAIFRK